MASRELDVLKGRAAACGVALGEDAVEDLQHGPHPVGEVVVGGRLEPRSRLADPVLGARDPLRHGAFGHEERAGDLRRGEPTDGPERQRHL
ncbi:hypothetical protein [Lapillicoccus sp.]|uniref:hypothetical protein n=1 Tax=Lapillicoccus sp. TaxID=1909287 RepID=UPI00344F2B5A